MENFEEMLEQYLPSIEKGETKLGKIIKKDIGEYAYLDIPGIKGEGKVNISEIEEYNVGDEIEVVILSDEEDDYGNIRVSRRVYELNENWSKVKEIFEKQEVVTGKIVKKVNGGYLVEILKYRCFMPGSLSLIREEDQDVLGKEIKVLIKDIKDEKNKKILVSRKEVKLKEEEKFLGNIKEGDILKVKIKELLDFGLSVEADSVVGFIHISEVSWKKVNKLDEMFNVGEQVEAKVISINKEKRSLKLSIKQLFLDPWKKAGDKYSVNTELEGKVVRIEKYGAFVELEPGIEALVHVSDLSWSKKVKSVEDYLKEGDLIKAKVIEADFDKKRIKISIKQLEGNPWDLASEKYAVGKEIEAKIVDTKEFGVFIELEEGVDAFIHISDLKWVNPSVEEYKLGDLIKAQIIDFDAENKKIKAGVKQLSKNPWDKVFEDYKVGESLDRKIVNIAEFGIFVEIEEGVDGMVHISESSKDYVKNLNDKFKVGDDITAEIIEMDREAKKIKLSIKAIEIKEEEKENEGLLEKYSTAE